MAHSPQRRIDPCGRHSVRTARAGEPSARAPVPGFRRSETADRSRSGTSPPRGYPDLPEQDRPLPRASDSKVCPLDQPPGPRTPLTRGGGKERFVTRFGFASPSDTWAPWRPSNPSLYADLAFSKARHRRPLEKVAEREGFEPPEPCGSTVFKTAAIDHSATPPMGVIVKDAARSLHARRPSAVAISTYRHPVTTRQRPERSASIACWCCFPAARARRRCRRLHPSAVR